MHSLHCWNCILHLSGSRAKDKIKYSLTIPLLFTWLFYGNENIFKTCTWIWDTEVKRPLCLEGVAVWWQPAWDFSSLFRLQSSGQPTSFFSSSWLKPNIQTESILVGDRPVKDKAGDQELASDNNLTEGTCHDVL